MLKERALDLFDFALRASLRVTLHFLEPSRISPLRGRNIMDSIGFSSLQSDKSENILFFYMQQFVVYRNKNYKFL